MTQQSASSTTITELLDIAQNEDLATSATNAVDAGEACSGSEVSIVMRRLRSGFNGGRTRSASWRHGQLDALEKMLRDNADRFSETLASDLGKPASEAWLTEIGFALSDIAHQRSKLKTWMKPRRRRVPAAFQPASARVVPEPKGVVLVIAPWNYPLQLTVSPVAAAIAAGNAVVVKPSEMAPATSAALAELMPAYLDTDATAVIEGGVDTATELLEQRFDHILFTGGENVGRIVMKAAAEHLTPVTLELGGKSPAIIASDADVAVIARRLTWGKLLNAGQTCIAPDYALVDRTVVGRLVDEIEAAIGEFYGPDPSTSRDYGRIINTRHHDRLSGLLDDPRSGRAVIGGTYHRDDRFFAPTVLVDTQLESAVMNEEIFGPILPIIAVDDVAEAIKIVNDRPKPLALYAFTRSGDTAREIVNRTSSGGVSVNDTLLHQGPHELPFGGVGASGMGAYHGQTGFDTFSHLKSVYDKRTHPNLKLIFPPYTTLKDRFIRLVQ